MSTTERRQFFPTEEDERTLIAACDALGVRRDDLAKAAFSRGLQPEIDARVEAAKKLSRAAGGRK